MSEKEVEIWKDIPDYEGYCQASSMGRIRSLDRTVVDSRGREIFYRGRLIEGSISNKGYSLCGLSINGVVRTFNFSQLVAMAFLGHEPNGNDLVVDHINGDKSDNRVENLRIVTNRANSSTCFRSDRSSLSSEYVGVCFNKATNKWHARIRINGKNKHLGYFKTELEAHNAYQNALKDTITQTTLAKSK